MTLPTLRTARLILRDWRDSDLAPLAAMSADPEVMALLMGPLDRAQSDALAGRCRAQIAREGFGFLAIEAPGIADFIGGAGLGQVPAALPCAPAIEVAWRLARPYWGHGYATEAATAVLEDGFGRLGLPEIVALTTPMNHRSRAVMERLGMSRNPDEDFDHPNIPEGHPLRRHVLYRLSRTAWQARS